MNEKVDLVIEKLYIHAAVVRGAISIIQEHDGDIKVANGLALSFREVEDSINDFIHSQTNPKKHDNF